MVTTELKLTVGPDGLVRVPADMAKPGETVTLRVERPTGTEAEQQLETDEPVRLTRLTAKTPEQKEQWRRQMNDLIDQLEPMLRGTPGSLDHGDYLYDENGLPK